MASNGTPPASGGANRNLGPIIVGINWMVFGPSTIMVGLRLITRTWITHNLGWDDWVMLLTQAINSCGMGFVMGEVFYGLGRHKHFLSTYQQSRFLKFDFLDWIQVFITLALMKISILLFLLRLSKFDHLRRILWFLIAFIVLTHLPLTVLLVLQCRPVEKYWLEDLPGTCWAKTTREKIVIVQGGKVAKSLGNVTAEIYKPFRFTAGITIVRTALSWEITSEDMTWVGVGNAFARIFEINLGIIAACIPLMKPFGRAIRNRLRTQRSTERLDSDEDLTKHSHWYSRWLQTCGRRDVPSSHGQNEPVSFDAYVRYTRDWHRRKRPPNAAAANCNPVMSWEPSVQTSLGPSVQSLQLPLHGVPGADDRYSTVDPIVELKGILETDFRGDEVDDMEIGRAL
ncbi:MAG: hypothetical protein Q9195_006583 [Heterodermia aff. obscurata]